MLGEFFAARPEEIDGALVAEGPIRRFETVEAKSLDAVSISMLGEILGVGTYDELVNSALDEERQAEGGEAGLTPVATAVRDALASADDLEAVGEQWGKTEELSEWGLGDVHEVVRQLAALATKAREMNQELWLWWAV